MPRNADRIVGHLTGTNKRSSFRSISHRANFIGHDDFFTSTGFPRRSEVFVCRRPSTRAQTIRSGTSSHLNRSPYPTIAIPRYFY